MSRFFGDSDHHDEEEETRECQDGDEINDFLGNDRVVMSISRLSRAIIAEMELNLADIVEDLGKLGAGELRHFYRTMRRIGTECATRSELNETLREIENSGGPMVVAAAMKMLMIGASITTAATLDSVANSDDVPDTWNKIDEAQSEEDGGSSDGEDLL